MEEASLDVPNNSTNVRNTYYVPGTVPDALHRLTEGGVSPINL